MKAKKIIASIIIALGIIVVSFSLLLKCCMFGFSNTQGSEYISIYAYTLNEEKTRSAANDLFSSGIYLIDSEKARELKASDISATKTKVYISHSGYTEDGERTFIDRFYTLYLMTLGSVAVIAGINLLSEKDD